MRWFHSASVIPDGASLRRASAGDMTGFSRKLLIFEGERSPATGTQQGADAGRLLCFRKLRRRDRQQAGNAAAADIIDAREYDVVALDFHQNGRGQALAVELAERHGEIGSIGIPADG